MRIAFALVFCVGCKSGTHDSAPATASGSAPGSGSGPGSGSAAAKPAEPPKPAAPAIKPTRVDGVGGGDKSFDITLPPGVKVTVAADNEEQLPSAHFEGKGLDFMIERPEYWPEHGWSLEQEKGTMDRGTDKPTYERTDDRGETWTMIYKRAPTGGAPGGYSVDVAFRTPELMCRATALESRAKADEIAAICETFKFVEPAKTKH